MADEVVRNDLGAWPAQPAVRLTEVFKRVSWGAIWAGVMAALGMEVLFALFGVFIGFAMYDSNAANPWAGVPSWSLAWYLVTIGWSMFFGGWCAARLSNDPGRGVATLHAVATWGLSVLGTIGIIVLLSWPVLRVGVNAAVVSAATSNGISGPPAQAAANEISNIALRVWGGVLFGFVAALAGGALGKPGIGVPPAQREIPTETRRAA